MEEPASDVLRFIEEQIDSVPHIETLLLLWEIRPRGFTPAEMARRLFVDEATARRLLQDLHLKKLVKPEVEGAGYAYDSAWDETGEFFPRIAATYRRHLIRVATLIHSKTASGIREFARAFEPKQE